MAGWPNYPNGMEHPQPPADRKPYQPSQPPAGFSRRGAGAVPFSDSFDPEHIRTAINREMDRAALLAVEIARHIQKGLTGLDQIQSTSWSADSPRVDVELVDGSTFTVTVEHTP